MATSTPPKTYPSDVCDDEWAFVAPYLTLLALDALQRKHDVRAVFNALRYLAHTGAPWRYLPGDFPPWPAVYQQARRWMDAGCFEALVHDLRLLLRVLHGRQPQPRAAILDARVLQSRPESGARAGYDGHKRRRGSKIHQAVATLGSLLALTVSPASADERTQVAALAAQVQAATGAHVERAWVDQGYPGEAATQAAAAAHGIQLAVVRWPGATRGFVLLPRRWVVESTQPHYPQCALDVQYPTCHDRAHRIGRTGLLNLLQVVARRRAGQAHDPQEGGVPCPSAPLPPRSPSPSFLPALPPIPERASVQSVGASAARQSPTAAPAARPPRRTPTAPGRSPGPGLRRGGGA